MNAKYLVAKKENGIFSILAHDLVLKPYVYMLYCDLFSYFVKQSISLAQFTFLQHNLKSLYENVSGNLLGHITHRTPIHLNQPSKQVCTTYTDSTTFSYKSFSAEKCPRGTNNQEGVRAMGVTEVRSSSCVYLLLSYCTFLLHIFATFHKLLMFLMGLSL